MSRAIIEMEGTWEELAMRASEFAGRRLRLTVLPDEEETPEARLRAEQERRLRVKALLKLPLEERDRILERQAAQAEALYRSDPDLTDFEALGEKDFYDETP